MEVNIIEWIYVDVWISNEEGVMCLCASLTHSLVAWHAVSSHHWVCLREDKVGPILVDLI